MKERTSNVKINYHLALLITKGNLYSFLGFLCTNLYVNSYRRVQIMRQDSGSNIYLTATKDIDLNSNDAIMFNL